MDCTRDTALLTKEYRFLFTFESSIRSSDKGNRRLSMENSGGGAHGRRRYLSPSAFQRRKIDMYLPKWPVNSSVIALMRAPAFY